MVPLEQLRESSFYQWILQEGWQEGEKKGHEHGLQEGEVAASAAVLELLIQKRFPELDVTAEISGIQNAALLQQLCGEVIDLPDGEKIKQRLANARADLAKKN